MISQIIFFSLLANSINTQDSQPYWNAFYINTPADIESPSPFAEAVLPLIPKNGCLLELGCGNGRDAKYFAKHNIEVYACDLCKNAIDKLRPQTSNPTFFEANFTDLGSQVDNLKIVTVYSRFTFHSITKAESGKVIQWTYDHLQQGGLFLIEARSVHDPLYGKGELVEKDAYVTDHFRRFIVIEELVEDLQKVGFIIQSAKESRGFAPFREEDPPVIRIVAEK